MRRGRSRRGRRERAHICRPLNVAHHVEMLTTAYERGRQTANADDFKLLANNTGMRHETTQVQRLAEKVKDLAEKEILVFSCWKQWQTIREGRPFIDRRLVASIG